MDDLALTGHLDRSRERIIDILVEWLRIPSISADPQHAGDVANSAQFCADLLRDAGLKSVEVLAPGTEGQGARRLR